MVGLWAVRGRPAAKIRANKTDGTGQRSSARAALILNWLGCRQSSGNQTKIDFIRWQQKEQSVNSISEKIQGWIQEGKDVRSAHWQGALEQLMDVFSPALEPGKLVPVHNLEDEDMAVFAAALGVVDLSPGLLAAFLPPSIAGSITPPESADELQRIDKGKPSYKVLVARPGEDLRLLCAEISAHAKKPGVDIFQSGAFLGSYDYSTQEECLPHLTSTLRSHFWEKRPWSRDGYKRYTSHWFEKVLDLGSATVAVEKSCSYLHSPTLIQTDRVDAVFTLIHDTLMARFAHAPDAEAMASLQNIADAEVRTDRCHDLIQERVLALLNVMRDGEMIAFDEFSDRESEQFKRELSGTVRRIARQGWN